jgi:hypothetical protein
MFLSGESFSKIFYDVMLRLKVCQINEIIYEAIEQFVLYINVHLRVAKFEYNKLYLLEKNLLGYEFIFGIYKESTIETVSTASFKFLSSILHSHLSFTDNAAEAISFFYSSLVFEHLNEAYSNLSIRDNDQTINRVLQFAILLLNEVNSFKDQSILRPSNSEVIELYVCDQRYSSNQEKLTIYAGKYELLREFKKKLSQKFWLEPEKINLLSKGNFLKGEDKSLNMLGIKNRQTIMILEKAEDEDKISQKGTISQLEQINSIKNIFPNLENDFIKMALEQKDQDVVETIILLSDPGRLNDLQEEFKNHFIYEKSFKIDKKLKFYMKNRFSSHSELFMLLFKITSIKDQDKKFLAWSLLKILPPVPALLESILAFVSKISVMTSENIDILLRDPMEVEDSPILCEKNNSDAILEFDLFSIIRSTDEISIYKLHIFANLLSTVSQIDDEYDADIKFELQKKFILDKGLVAFLYIFDHFIERVTKITTIDSPTLVCFGLISNVIKGYFFVHLLLKNPDPYKRSKQIFCKRSTSINQNLKKLEELETTFKKNYSTDNIFSQNLNSPKTHKSPHSLMTPGFQSPSNFIRHFSVDFLKLTQRQTKLPRKRRCLIFRVHLYFTG